MIRPTAAPALVLLVVLAACGDEDAVDTDGGADAGRSDADAGRPPRDSGPDAAGLDASPPDSGIEMSLPVCDVLAAFDLGAIEPPAEGSEGYVVPTADEIDAAEAMVRAAATERWEDALARAALVSYEVCRGTGGEEGLILLAPLPPARGWARVALRTGAARSVIIEAPHPLHDADTLPESVVLFTSLGARALVVSGAHRCANAAAGCEGTSTACGDPPGYRESDPAHATGSIFHRAHVALADVFFGDTVVSVHGMDDDGVSVSDGTTDPVDADAPVSRVAAALVAADITEVTACNAGAGVPVNERSCGTANVQGRQLNGSPDACTTSASSSSKRFVHLEQSPDVRARAPDVVAALATALPD